MIKTIDKLNGFEVIRSNSKNPPCGEAGCCEKLLDIINNLSENIVDLSENLVDYLKI